MLSVKMNRSRQFGKAAGVLRLTAGLGTGGSRTLQRLSLPPPVSPAPPPRQKCSLSQSFPGPALSPSRRARVKLPDALGAGVGQGAGSSGFAGGLAQHIAVDMLERRRLRERLAAADRQFQAVRIEINLD